MKNNEFEKEMRKKILQGNFAKNNGRILRAINVLTGKFINLELIKDAVGEYMDSGEFFESIEYLYKSFYIEVKTKGGKTIDEIYKYPTDYLEVCLNQKGIKLAKGFITDEAVEI